MLSDHRLPELGLSSRYLPVRLGTQTVTASVSLRSFGGIAGSMRRLPRWVIRTCGHCKRQSCSIAKRNRRFVAFSGRQRHQKDFEPRELAQTVVRAITEFW
jgi:hypothetical protein